MIWHILAGLVGGYVFISLAEWYVHKNEMHNPGFLWRLNPGTFLRHQKRHHPAYQTDFHAANPAGDADVGTRLRFGFNMMFAAPIMILLGVFLPVEAAVLFLLAVLHGVVWNLIHPEMHHPEGRWFSKTRWFLYLQEYHRNHHKHWATNFNVVAIGADHVMGTLYRAHQDAQGGDQD